MDINAIVLKTLEEQGVAMKSGEIAEKAGIDKKEVDKAIGKLKKEEKIFSPKNCFYAVKK
jgi:transcription initiation factor IIE alpha subunit